MDKYLTFLREELNRDGLYNEYLSNSGISLRSGSLKGTFHVELSYFTSDLMMYFVEVVDREANDSFEKISKSLLIKLIACLYRLHGNQFIIGVTEPYNQYMNTKLHPIDKEYEIIFDEPDADFAFFTPDLKILDEVLPYFLEVYKEFRFFSCLFKNRYRDMQFSYKPLQHVFFSGPSGKWNLRIPELFSLSLEVDGETVLVPKKENPIKWLLEEWYESQKLKWLMEENVFLNAKSFAAKYLVDESWESVMSPGIRAQLDFLEIDLIFGLLLHLDKTATLNQLHEARLGEYDIKVDFKTDNSKIITILSPVTKYELMLLKFDGSKFNEIKFKKTSSISNNH